jgi:hypothetical protein
LVGDPRAQSLLRPQRDPFAMTIQQIADRERLAGEERSRLARLAVLNRTGAAMVESPRLSGLGNLADQFRLAREQASAVGGTLGAGILTGVPQTANLLAAMRDPRLPSDVLRRYHQRGDQSAAGVLGSAISERMDQMPGQEMYNAWMEEARRRSREAGIPESGQLALEIGTPDLTDIGHLAAMLPAKLGKKGSRAAEGAATATARSAVTELSVEDAVATIRERVRRGDRAGWFRDADKNYKGRLVRAVEEDPKVRAAALRIFHDQYQKGTGSTLSFQEFLDTPITLYRGGKAVPRDEPFASFSYSKETAQKFAPDGKTVEEITVRPRETLGMMQTTAEGEVLIPTPRAAGSTLATSLPIKGKQ